MKEIIKRDAIVPYKVLRKPSALPYLATGLAVLAYGFIKAIVSPWDYILGGIVAVVVFFVAKGVWPGERVTVDLPPDTGDAQADQLLTEAREALLSFRVANDRIADAGVSKNIENIESTCLKILDRLEEQPALGSQLRTFLRYYLSTTKKLLDARAAIEQEDKNGERARLVMDRTDRVLPEIEAAFGKQLEALDKHKYLDLEVEIDVMEGMLKADGFTEVQKSVIEQTKGDTDDGKQQQ